MTSRLLSMVFPKMFDFLDQEGVAEDDERANGPDASGGGFFGIGGDGPATIVVKDDDGILPLVNFHEEFGLFEHAFSAAVEFSRDPELFLSPRIADDVVTALVPGIQVGG